MPVADYRAPCFADVRYPVQLCLEAVYERARGTCSGVSVCSGASVLETVLLYLTIILMAATPWVEILVVIPFGISVGLNPILVGLFAFAGNAGPIYLIVVGFERFNAWWARRRGKYLVNPSDESWQTGRRARAMNILRKYGVPGMALAGPILIGAHLAAVITLLVGAPRQQIFIWMTASLAIWTIAITVASFYGIGWLTSLW